MTVMNEEHFSIAKTVLNAAHDGTLSFPEIVGSLIKAGFEGYLVDYRRNTQAYYLPNGDSVLMELPGEGSPVTEAFKADVVEAQVRWAQANGPDYSYEAFSSNVRNAGCAGYLVSFLGRRVVYFGRTGETHVEHFPS